MWTSGWWRPPAVTGAVRRNLPENAHLWISPGPEVALLDSICEKKTLGSPRSHGQHYGAVRRRGVAPMLSAELRTGAPPLTM
jgi:hypothetical protein